MKYLTTTFAIACMAFGFASIVATPAQANESWECAQDGGQWSPTNDGGWTCLHPVEAQVKDVEPLERYAEDGYDRARQEADWIGEDESGNIVYEKDGRVIGVEVASGEDWSPVCTEKGKCYGRTTPGGRKSDGEAEQYVFNTKPEFCNDPENASEAVCRVFGYTTEETEGTQVAWDTEPSYGEGCWGTLCTHNGSDGSPKSEEVQGEQFARGEQPSVKSPNSNDNGSASERTGQRYACSGNDWKYGCKPTKTPTGTFYPLPMVDVASMEKLLAPGGTNLTAFTDRHGKSFGDSDYQFADREDGSGGDFGNSGGDFGGEGDRAAASTAAE